MPIDLPPLSSPPAIELRQQPSPQQVPQVDIAVEVVGNLPLQEKLVDLSRRLGRRQIGSINRSYPPTILDLIMLVKRNPEKPRDKAWGAVGTLHMRSDPATRTVTMEYCVEHCGYDLKTGAFDPKRKTVSYSASQDEFEKKVNQKLDDLKNFAERPPSPDYSL